MPMKTPWTSQEIDVLKQMAGAGKSVEEINRVLIMRSTTAISCKAHELGVVIGRPQIDFEAFKQIMRTVRQPKCV